MNESISTECFSESIKLYKRFNWAAIVTSSPLEAEEAHILEFSEDLVWTLNSMILLQIEER